MWKYLNVDMQLKKTAFTAKSGSIKRKIKMNNSFCKALTIKASFYVDLTLKNLQGNLQTFVPGVLHSSPSNFGQSRPYTAYLV
jgi:hypothetical protein